MQSSSLDITHCWTTLVMECLHVPWAGNIGRRHQEGHAIIVMDNKQGQTMSRVACYHCPWTENTARQQRAGMHSYTLECTYGRKTLSVSCYQHIWASHTVE